jgi:pentose-5-phosphate-3-epimerase
MLVAGTAVFGQEDYRGAIARIRTASPDGPDKDGPDGGA